MTVDDSYRSSVEECRSRPHSLLAFLCSVFKEHPNGRRRPTKTPRGNVERWCRPLWAEGLSPSTAPEGWMLSDRPPDSAEAPSERLVNIPTRHRAVNRVIRVNRAPADRDSQAYNAACPP